MKKTRKRIKIYNFITMLFAVTVIIYLACSICLHSVNVNYASQLAVNEARIEELKSEVDALTIQVKELTDYNRVMDTVDGDMSSNTSIVVSIGDGAN
ncbi:MAG TPA: hypothetical protein PLI19_05230 [Erysipelotrichaceae bacterium]|nr:hypothetical protein [Erysipelotrichaceae bacterium]HQB32716.1 hypothetical protein [Erysipelotrichaceae bacterium]